MKAQLIIAYQVLGASKIMALASIDDQQLLVAAARHAIARKVDEARRLGAADAGLGVVATAEAGRLREVLGALIPECE